LPLKAQKKPVILTTAAKLDFAITVVLLVTGYFTS